MSTKPKGVKDFDPQSQHVGHRNAGGGSQPTPQTQRMHRGSGKVATMKPFRGR